VGVLTFFLNFDMLECLHVVLLLNNEALSIISNVAKVHKLMIKNYICKRSVVSFPSFHRGSQI